MVDEQDGIPVGDEVVHDRVQAVDVRRVQPDRGLVQHVEHAGRPVAHRAGKLHPLALAGGERGSGAVEREVGEAEVHQPARRRAEGIADAFGHRAHRRGQRGRHVIHPADEGGERHAAGLVQPDAAELRRAGRIGKARAAAVGADVLLQELFHPLHALFVLDLGQRVFHRVNGVVIGEVELAGLFGILGVVEDVLFHGGTVVDDVLFLCRKRAERDVRADAHRPADVGHQRPHQRVPRRDSALVDRERFVRYERAAVDRPHDAGPAAGGAGALAVEGQLLGARREEAHAAHGAGQRLALRNGQRRREIMPVRAAVAGQAGEHQPQTVEQLRAGAEGAADAGHAGPLVQSERGRHVQHLVHVGLCGLRHAPPGVGGEGLEIAPGALRIQHAEGQRGLPGAGHPGDADDPVQRHVDVDIFQIVDSCAPDFDCLRGFRPVIHADTFPE